MKFGIKKRNTPIATLIKNYVNKKSGKVSDSREEIQRRFDFLDWKDQKKIVQAFLESGKADRQWAYSKALDFWDKSFEPKIKELWEQLHEYKCSWVVIRHFPVEYLSQNLDMFTEERDYYFICLRLAEDKNYVIEKDKLSFTDYLAVLYHTGRSISEKDAYDILFEIVHSISIGKVPGHLWQLDRYADSDKGDVISPICFQDISLAIYYLKKMNRSLVASQFEEWNHLVQLEIFDSPEYKAICKQNLVDYEYKAAAMCVAKKYAYLALDEKYKKTSDPDIESILEPKEWFIEPVIKEKASSSCALEPSDPTVLKEMMAENPAIEKLIGNFGLDAENLPF